MKVTTRTVTRIELEDGDNAYDLYEELGKLPPGPKIRIINGAIELHD